MHVADRADELREIDVGDVLADTFVRLDLVKQVPALGKLHGDPPPGGIFTGMEEGNDIVMVTDMLVHRDLHLQLPRTYPAMAGGVFLVDELDGEDRIVFLKGTSLLDAANQNSQRFFFVRLERVKPN